MNMTHISKTNVFLLSIGIIFLGAMSGCVSTKRHNRDVGVLQSQIGQLSNQVTQLEQQEKKSFWGGLKQKPVGESMEAGAGTSSLTYRTPSGFELPAADIQRALAGAGFYQGEVDGKIGPDTRQAIREFQRSNGLTADGICGRKTWELLQPYLTNSSVSK